MPRGLVAQSFRDNGIWGEVKTDSYNAVLFKNGQFEVDVKNTVKFRASFIQRWKYFQHFPEIKFLRASLKKNYGKTISVTYKYLWNGGTVEENLIFNCRSISVSCAFLPWGEKETRNFTCLLKMRTPEKKEMELVAMDRKGTDGALKTLGKWKQIRFYFKMASLRNAGPYLLDFISEGQAWINIWKYPNMAVIKNAKKRIWDNTVYQKNEEYKIEYLVYISKSNGTNIKSSAVLFERKEID